MRKKYTATLNNLPVPEKRIKGDFNIDVKLNSFDPRLNLLDRLSDIFTPATGNGIASNLFSTYAVYQSFFQFLIKAFNLQDPANWAAFEKNIKDGYTSWFYHLYQEKSLSSNGFLRKSYKNPYSVYENLKWMQSSLDRTNLKQTEGIKEFIKIFKPLAWKRLVKLSPAQQYAMVFDSPNFSRTFVILSKVLEKCPDTDMVNKVYAAITATAHHFSFDSWLENLDEVIEFVIRSMENKGEDACLQRGINTVTISDLVDHFEMHKRCLSGSLMYPEITKELGKVFSGRWSARRFHEEHSKLSGIFNKINNIQFLENENENKWKKKSFYNINKFPEIKEFDVKVSGVSLKVSLINSNGDLFKEGTEMKHCIFTYSDSMKKGSYVAFKIRDISNPKNNSTIGFAFRTGVPFQSRGNFTTDEVSKTKPVKEEKVIHFDQLRGLRNHTDFTFDTQRLIRTIGDRMQACGFKDYLIGRQSFPLVRIKRTEQEIEYRLQHGLVSQGPVWTFNRDIGVALLPENQGYNAQGDLSLTPHGVGYPRTINTIRRALWMPQLQQATQVGMSESYQKNNIFTKPAWVSWGAPAFTDFKVENLFKEKIARRPPMANPRESSFLTETLWSKNTIGHWSTDIVDKLLQSKQGLSIL